MIQCPAPPSKVPDPDTATDKELADFILLIYSRLRTCARSVEVHNELIRQQEAYPDLPVVAPVPVAKP